MKDIFVNFVWPYVKSHLADKAFWNLALNGIVFGANHLLKLGLTDSTSAVVVTFLTNYVLTHFFHSNTIGKDTTNA